MDKYELHLALLERWNRTINLTSITNPIEARRKHIDESLFLASHLPPGELKICDLGSGGGFPGIPVAISRPDCHVTLIESDVRKGVFLREASRQLPNVSVLTQRFEAVTGEFDWLISRAVNLAKTKGGPVCQNAAFLGKVLDTNPVTNPKANPKPKTNPSLALSYDWREIPIPWDPPNVLSLGMFHVKHSEDVLE